MFVAIFGVLSTLVPVILSMAPSTHDATANTSGTCEPTDAQIAQVQLTFGDKLCTYDNVTVGSLLRH
jgi:hypothetical protein